jgi:mannose-6-phosphate isomerase
MSQEPIYPLTFDPVFKNYLWGGRNLEIRLGRAIPAGVVAESWEIAAHRDGSSTVNWGPLEGLTLPAVQERLGQRLVGSRNAHTLSNDRFPLLVKTLDANRWLSVQVHPDDEYALTHEDDLGKTEMWVILFAEPGAELIVGFEPGVTKDRFERAVEEEEVERWLHRVPVKPGDVIFLPAGAIHALGPGIIVAEIQQNSNTTYRIHDWGRPRPVHIPQALDVLDFSLVRPQPVSPQPCECEGARREILAHCPYFHTERISIAAGGSYENQCNGETFEIWSVVDGSAAVHWPEGMIALPTYSWVLLPAALGSYRIEAEGTSTLLRVLTPESR